MSAFRNISVVITGDAAPLVAAYGEASTATAAFAREQAAASAAMRELGAASAANAGRLGSLESAAARSAASTRGLGASAAAARAETAGFSSTLVQAERSAGAMASTAGVAEGRMASMGATLTSAAASASRAGQAMTLVGQVGAVGLAVGLVASVAAAAKFDAEMHNVASIDATVRDNFAATESQILSLSRTLPQSAQTLAEGLYNISSSGFYGADAMQILGVSARAASAGLTTTDTASKAIVASLNAYGLGASSATRVSDALFSTVNYGVISFGALTSAVANSVGNAAQAKVGIEQLGSALATMTLSGMSASSAGVSLNNLLSKLVKPSAALSQEFAKLHISTSDIADSSTGLYGVMEQLGGALDQIGASGGNVTQTLLTWFPEIRAARGAMALLAGDSANYTRVIGLMGTAQDNAGATARVFNEQMKSTSAQLDIAKNKIEATGISIGAALLPYLNDGIAGLTRFLGSVRDLGAEVASGAAPGVRDLGRALGDLASIAHSVGLDTLAGQIAHLGVEGAVVAFDGLARAVSGTTGFLRDNQVAVMALALAWAAFKAEAIATSVLTLSARLATLATSLYSSVTYLPTAIALWTQYRLANEAAAADTTVLRLALGTLGTAAAAAGIVIAALVVSYKLMEQEQAKVKGQITDIQRSMDPTSMQSMQIAMTQLTAAQKEYNSSIDGMLTQDASVRANRKEQAKAISDLAAAIKTENDAADQLGKTFGFTREQVEAVATANRVQLSQGISSATEAGQKNRDTMIALLNPLANARLSTSDLATVMKALDTDTSAADTALKMLETTFDVLSGKGIDAETALNDWRIALLNVASGESLAANATGGHTASLDTNTIAGLTNRNAILSMLKTNQANAEAVYKLDVATGNVGKAQDDYNASLNNGLIGLKAAWMQAGVTSNQFDTLAGSVDSVPAGASIPVSTPGLEDATNNFGQLPGSINQLPPGVNLPVSTPGALNSAQDLAAIHDEADGIGADRRVELTVAANNADVTLSQLLQLQGAVTTLPADRRIELSVPGADLSMSQIGGVAGAISTLPADRRTEISVPGAELSSQQAQHLYGIVSELPADRRTEISAPGAPQATDLVSQFLATTGRMPPAKWTDISAPGATASTGQTQAFIDTVAAMAASKATNISSPGATGAKAEVDNLRAAIDALHDKSVTVTTVQRQIIEQAYYTATSPGSPALTYGLQGAATGGEIRGPGTPTSDSILARLSDREWVIQAASAAKYGHAAMASINAGTATVIPGPTAGYALGGQVGPVRPPGFAGGGMVSGGGYGSVVNNNISMSIAVTGGATNGETAAIVGAEVRREFGRLVSHIRAGVS